MALVVYVSEADTSGRRRPSSLRQGMCRHLPVQATGPLHLAVKDTPPTRGMSSVPGCSAERPMSPTPAVLTPVPEIRPILTDTNVVGVITGRQPRLPDDLEGREHPLLPLLEAAWSKGADAVRALLDEGADVAETNDMDDTALHWAAAAGDVASVRALLSAGARLAAASVQRHWRWSEGGYLALHWAASGGDVPTIRALLAAGTPVDTPTDGRATALHCAAKAGRVAAIRALLDARAGVNVSTSFGETPLHCAAYSGNTTAVQMLLSAGANVGACSRAGLTALHMVGSSDGDGAVRALLLAGSRVSAAACNSSHVFEMPFLTWFLCYSFEILARDAPGRLVIESGVTPLHNASRHGNVASMKALLCAGDQVDAMSDSGRTALHEAGLSGSAEAVQTLLDAGACVDGADKHGKRALHEAGVVGSAAAVQTLLDAEANLDRQDNHGNSALHYAGRSGSAATVQTLLDAGANVMRVDWWGRTPLNQAGLSGSAAAVQTMLLAGAAVIGVDRIGSTELLNAGYSGSAEVLQALLDAGAKAIEVSRDGRTALHTAASSGSTAALQTLLSAGANVNVAGADSRGCTALHLAAGSGSASAVQTLLDAGACLDGADNDGATALHRAGRSGSAAAVRTLLDAGAIVSGADSAGCTALHKAASADYHGALDALCKAGACTEARDNRGRSPLHVAAELGRLPVVAALLRHLTRPPPDGEVNAVDQDDRTPLHYAAAKGHAAVVALLLRHGAHSAVVDRMGQTPLFFAASLGHEAIVDQLGAEQPTKAVSTPLHGAATYGRVALFSKPQLLPFLSVADETGSTPLHIAASSVHAPSVRALVALGGDVHLRNGDGETPWDRTVAWLERAVQDAETDCTRAAVRKDVRRRMHDAAAGHVAAQGQTDGELDLTGVPWRVCRKLEDFRAVALCFLTAGVRVRGGGHSGIKWLCMRIVRGADGFGPRQFARLAITGLVGRPAADQQLQGAPSRQVVRDGARGGVVRHQRQEKNRLGIGGARAPLRQTP